MTLGRDSRAHHCSGAELRESWSTNGKHNKASGPEFDASMDFQRLR